MPSSSDISDFLGAFSALFSFLDFISGSVEGVMPK